MENHSVRTYTLAHSLRSIHIHAWYTEMFGVHFRMTFRWNGTKLA